MDTKPTRKESRSVLRTQNLLKNGLTDLMKQKPLQKITVKELTDYVNLNRGTFYLHYKDIFDLMDQIENAMLEDFVTINQTHKVLDMNGHPYPLLRDLFTFLKENAEFTRILIIDNRDQNFVDKIKDILKQRCLTDWHYLFSNYSEQKSELYSSYVIYGCIGMIENWLKNGLRETPEELAAYADHVILQGLQSLNKI